MPSLTMGAGQFCTNPGLLLAIRGPGLEDFEAAASAAINASSDAPMLTTDIHASYQAGIDRLVQHPRVTKLAGGARSMAPQGQPVLFATAASDFLSDESLGYEVFGASSLLVRCEDEAEMIAILHAVEGQLTATMHLDDDDTEMARRLLPQLERKAGRILANGWPTGVEVSHAMIHGGPFPATSDARTTSVGTLAIDRFLRPVTYQNFPADLLPSELARDSARWPRLFDGNASYCAAGTVKAN